MPFELSRKGLIHKDVFYEKGMETTRILDRGFDAVLNVFTGVTGEEIGHVFEWVSTKLIIGEQVSLADLQEIFGIRKTRYSERLFLQEGFETDWNWIFFEDSTPGDRIAGVSITVSGFYKER